MEAYVVEARRRSDGPWCTVVTVQEDLVDEIAPMVGGPGEWRLRPTDAESDRPAVPTHAAAKIALWDRVRWWAILRFSKRARR